MSGRPIELAGLQGQLDCAKPLESGGKPRAIQTLREVRRRSIDKKVKPPFKSTLAKPCDLWGKR